MGDGKGGVVFEGGGDVIGVVELTSAANSFF